MDYLLAKIGDHYVDEKINQAKRECELSINVDIITYYDALDNTDIDNMCAVSFEIKGIGINNNFIIDDPNLYGIDEWIEFAKKILSGTPWEMVLCDHDGNCIFFITEENIGFRLERENRCENVFSLDREIYGQKMYDAIIEMINDPIFLSCYDE